MPALHQLTALEQAAAIRRREVSPLELVSHHLARIEEHSAAFGAFVTVTADSALEQARAAEQLILTSSDPAELPALLGVPTAIKDLDAVAGVPMKLGGTAFADLIPDYDDDVVVRLRAAGTISLGKTNTPELGLPCYTEPDPSIAPPARSPWAPALGAGGSSGGAAAAVAAGLVPWAQGSDGGGSIRIPASCCGLVGLKPSRGRVSTGPTGDDVGGLAVIGPLTRTVADAAAMLDAIAGPGPGDATWAPPLAPGDTFLAAAGRDPGRLRIGRCLDNVAGAPLAPECAAGWELASRLLADLGHEVFDVPVPAFGDLFESFRVVWAAGAASAPIPPRLEPQLRPLTRWLRELGRGVDAVSYLAALDTLQRATRAHLVASAGYDLLLTPTLAQLPAPVGSLRDDADPAADFEAQTRFTPFTALWNTTGQPAISLPLHHTEPREGARLGLPVGVQLVGRPAGESTLLAVAGQLEASAPWRHRGPPVP